MNHLEQFKVKFLGNKSRQVVDNGVVRNYNRGVFAINGKYYSVNTADKDISGKAGIVMFVKAGETSPTGAKVAQDAFSLVLATSAGTASAAQAAFDEL